MFKCLKMFFKKCFRFMKSLLMIYVEVFFWFSLYLLPCLNIFIIFILTQMRDHTQFINVSDKL